VTKIYGEINILEESGKSNNCYCLFDTFGIRHHKDGQDFPPPDQWTIANSNFAKCLTPIINGELPPGYKEWSPFSAKDLIEPDINDKIHAIIFIIDINTIEVADQVRRIKEFLTEIVNLGFNPIVVFTKCDGIMKAKIEPATGREKEQTQIGRDVQLKNIFDDAELRRKVTDFCKNVNLVQEHDVFFIANYIKKYHPEERDYAKELLLLNILETSKQRAESYIKNYFKSHVKIMVSNDDDCSVGSFEYNSVAQTLNNFTSAIQSLLETKYKGFPDCHKFKFVETDTYGQESYLAKNEMKKTQLRNVLINEEDGGRSIQVYLEGLEKFLESRKPALKKKKLKSLDIDNKKITSVISKSTSSEEEMQEEYRELKIPLVNFEEATQKSKRQAKYSAMPGEKKTQTQSGNDHE